MKTAARRVALETLGWVLVVAGIAALVLPGPGLLAIFAGLALVQKRGAGGPRVQLGVFGLGLFGAALLYGDGIITPAISVLSAAEGLAVFEPRFASFVVPLTLVILVALFLIQRRGTAGIGAIFGPVTFLWFAALAALGARGIAQRPEVLWALSPAHAVAFFAAHGVRGFIILGAVFLVVTGSEALYADMGHFGRRPIRLTWFSVVLPALLLNYFGQGSLLLADPTAIHNPFYLLAPSWAVLPMVVLATAAACIAAQAVISGAFSLTRQAVQLGFCPRMEIVHTSSAEIGQIYVPAVNWALLLGVLTLVLGFRTSSNLAGAYGIAVSSTMVITTVLAYVVARDVWRWKWWACALGVLPFVFIDLAFFGGNLVKITEGGWFPLLLACGVLVLMTTWKRGRSLLGERLREGTVPLNLFLKDLAGDRPERVPGTAVFMTGNPEGVPPALLHNLKHNKILHQRNVLLTIQTARVPHVDPAARLQIQPLDHGFFRVLARYGFMETPNITGLLGELRAKGLELRVMDTSFFLGRESLIASRRKGMSTWRKALFGWMAKNARPATAFFGIPPNRVVELGAQIEL